MGKVNRSKFKNDSNRIRYGSGAKYLGLKKLGEAKGYLHPRINLWERFTHGSLPSSEFNKSKNRYEICKRRWNCSGIKAEEVPNLKCPVCLLQEFAKEKIENGTNKEEIILDGGENLKFTLNDLAGYVGYWTDPKARQEIAFVWIPADAVISGEVKEAVRPETGAQALGTAIIDVIEEEIKERGAIAGNPCFDDDNFELTLRKGKMVLTNINETHNFHPYPLKLKFDSNAQGQNMYKAFKLDRDLVPLTNDIVQIMLASTEEIGINMERLTNPTDSSVMLNGLQSTWASAIVPFAEFDEYVKEKSTEKEKSNIQTPLEVGTESAQKDFDADLEFCVNCNAKLIHDAKFCQECGKENTEKFITMGSRNIAEIRSNVSDKNEKIVECKECKQKVSLMIPSCRCPECGCLHQEIKDNDVPF